MSKKIKKIGIKREDGFLYYIDKGGDVSRAKMSRGGKKGGKPQKVTKIGVKKEAGFLYYLDKAGDVARAKLHHAKSKFRKKDGDTDDPGPRAK